MPDGKVTYVKKGETYFLPYGVSDLSDPNRFVKAGDQVSEERVSMGLNLFCATCRLHST